MAGCQIKVEKKETLETGGWFGSFGKKVIFFNLPCRLIILIPYATDFHSSQQNKDYSAINRGYVICCGWMLAAGKTPDD